MANTFWFTFYWDIVLEFSQNTTFKFYKAAEKHYSGEMENICNTLRKIYSGNCVANYIRIIQLVLQKI